jgi:hypothetical protein
MRILVGIVSIIPLAVYASKLGPGGNSPVNTFQSSGRLLDFEGLLIVTWDPKAKAYKQ